MNKLVVNCADNSTELIPLTEAEILDFEQQREQEVQRHKDEDLAAKQNIIRKATLLEKLGITEDEARLLLL